MPPKKSTRTTLNEKQHYEAFLKQLKLLGLGLDKCSAKLDRHIYFELKADQTLREIAANYKTSSIGTDFFSAEAFFKLWISNKKTKGTALYIECTFSTLFDCKEKPSKQFVKQFADSELRLLIWPYFRQFVNDLTSRMAIQPVVVPLAEPE